MKPHIAQTQKSVKIIENLTQEIENQKNQMKRMSQESLKTWEWILSAPAEYRVALQENHFRKEEDSREMYSSRIKELESEISTHLFILFKNGCLNIQIPTTEEKGN